MRQKKYARMESPREGLNNQRIAILGFLILCSEKGYEPILPKYCIDHIPKNHNFQNVTNILLHPVAYASYYFQAKIKKPKVALVDIYHESLFDALDVKPISTFPATNKRLYRIEKISFSKSLAIGFRLLQTSEITPESKEILKFLRASSSISLIAKKCIEQLTLPIIAVGFRLEQDWIRHINSNIYTGSAMDREIFTVHNILSTLSNLRDDTGIGSFYLCCDSYNLTCTQQQVFDLASQLDINVYFQQHFRHPLYEFKSSISRSIFDFEIALSCTGWIGSDKSTFNNMIQLYSKVNDSMQIHYLLSSTIRKYSLVNKL